jgi:hypothetical protein
MLGFKMTTIVRVEPDSPGSEWFGGRMGDPLPPVELLYDWKPALVADFDRVARRDRWGMALMAIAWIHLAYSLVYQVFYTPDSSRGGYYILLWLSEVVVVLLTMRRWAGRGWFRSTPLAGVIVRVWATFLILSFSVATLNGLTGWNIDWFKLVWCTLGSFGFATMAWLLSLWFLVPAFQMYFTGLLMVAHPGLAYLIHGLSWWAALQGIGLVLHLRRVKLVPKEGETNPASPFFTV